MEDKILINDIVGKCLNYFEDNCYTKSRIARYKEYWRKGIIPFLQKQGSEFLTDQLAQAYLETCTHDGSVRHQEREMMRSVQVLVGLWHSGKTSRRYYTPAKHELTGQIGKAMEEFMTHLRNLRRGKSTLASYQLYLHDFLCFLQDNNVTQLSEVSEWHVVKYAKAQKECRVNKVSALRMLFNHRRLEQYARASTLCCANAAYPMRGTTMVPVYTISVILWLSTRLHKWLKTG